MVTPPALLLPILAVHISDGVLTGPWCAAGFIVAALLIVPAVWRMPTEEEIVRIALLTSAFFVASLIHVRVGPTSVHLLLNGLVGALLGWRAGLAIPTALLLQAALLGHGGITALGANSCILTLPAVFTAALFVVLHKPSLLAQSVYRAALVGTSVIVWSLTLVFSAVLLASNRFSLQDTPDPTVALNATLHPLTLSAVIALALACSWWERRLDHAPEFPLGLLLGLLSVLLTSLLSALVLHWGGAENWGSLILIVFVAHLPVAVIEGLILGFTLAFLARVKPELLGIEACRNTADEEPLKAVPSEESASIKSTASLLALLAALLTPSVARAHRLDADYRFLPDGVVEIECWFDLTGDSPRGAKVEVFQPDGSLLTQGKVDANGQFRFKPPSGGPFKTVINAGAGHRKEIRVSLAQGAGASKHSSPSQNAQSPETLAPNAPVDSSPAHARNRGYRPEIMARVATGLGIILVVAASLLGLRKVRKTIRAGSVSDGRDPTRR